MKRLLSRVTVDDAVLAQTLQARHTPFSVGRSHKRSRFVPAVYTPRELAFCISALTTRPPAGTARVIATDDGYGALFNRLCL